MQHLLASDVARILGLSAARVRQLDGALQPQRTAGLARRAMRLYDPETVSRYAEQRRARGLK